METNRLMLPGLMIGLWLGFVGEAQALYNPSTGRWLSRDPLGEQGGNNLFSYCANRPVDSIDANGLFGCSRPRTCYCCCVDDITTDPNPPKPKYVPYQPPTVWNPWGNPGSYNVPFDVVINLSYKHATAKDRDCKIQWLETWYAPSAPPWYAPNVEYGKPYDRTKSIAGDFPPDSSCGGAPSVRIPDTPGSRFVTPRSSWTQDLKIEVLVTSGADPACKQVCKYQQRKLTVTVKLRMTTGKPDSAFEGVGVKTE